MPQFLTAFFGKLGLMMIGPLQAVGVWILEEVVQRLAKTYREKVDRRREKRDQIQKLKTMQSASDQASKEAAYLELLSSLEKERDR